MGYHWTQFRAMVRKDWLTMKADPGKQFVELMVAAGYGVLIGWEMSLQ